MASPHHHTYWLLLLFRIPLLTLLLLPALLRAADQPPRDPFAPRGKIHIPIGIPNTNDRLKTFVEPEGCFSPGVGSYGIYFWATDAATGKLIAPTMDGIKVEHGLAAGGLPIPWSKWSAGPLEIKTEICQVFHESITGKKGHIVAARAFIKNTSKQKSKTTIYAALRPIGPAGFDVHKLEVKGTSLFVDSFPALVASADRAVVRSDDTIASVTQQGKWPAQESAKSEMGDCSGAVAFDFTLFPGETETIGFICPVLTGRRVLPHQWDGTSAWAQFDLAPYNPQTGGELQANLDDCAVVYSNLKIDDCFDQAEKYWKSLAARATLNLPDPRWSEALSAITAHAALCMNDAAPDVAVVNYNVFNRDGVYVTSILQKAGCLDLAEKCIDYFLAHPFNGRVQPEADNPGQILWIMGQHWRFSRDAKWLARTYPGAAKIASMIRYYRTTSAPHYVFDTSLDFGDALPKQQRKLLKPGACDGHHPEYTEAFDIAGLRAAAILANAVNKPDDEKSFTTLADDLLKQYDEKFGQTLRKAYGSYCVLWPCALYGEETRSEKREASSEKDKGQWTNDKGQLTTSQSAIGNRQSAMTQFSSIGPQKPSGWRYFPLATAHQGLLSGNRDAAHKTIALHLDHEQIKGFCAFDEGGKSGAGGWKDNKNNPRLRTTWNPDVAMPHGWAIAELHLLIRDSLAFEQGGKLILLAGIRPEWFNQEIKIENLPTHFGPLTFHSTPANGGLEITLSGVTPPNGTILRLPSGDQQIPPGKSAIKNP